MDRKIVLIAEDIRSSLNVGSLLRTADGINVSKVYLCGYTPYPLLVNDSRPPYLAERINRQIKKSALGAEISQPWQYYELVSGLIYRLKEKGYQIVALEQTAKSVNLVKYRPKDKIALVLGNELVGVSKETLKLCDLVVEIPMLGNKESFNVSAAAAMTMFYLRYMV